MTDRTSDPSGAPSQELALCMSGGGFRAMAFHTGALWRLNELGYLKRLNCVSTVSGGAVPAALLGLRFDELDFDRNGVARGFVPAVVDPIRAFTRHSIETAAVIEGILNPGAISERLVDRYQRELFGDATLADLPHSPRFVFAAVNVQSAELVHISRELLRDRRVGEMRPPVIPLARVVAASAAVPPAFSPVHVELDAADFEPDTGADLQHEPYTTDMVLTNGGFLDKLALTAVRDHVRVLLVSDGGAAVRDDPEPHNDWRHHAHRILQIADREARARHKRELLDAFRQGKLAGAYWSLRSDLANFELKDALPCPAADTMRLAHGPSRLKRLQRRTQDQLINWGYAACDTAMRKHVDPKLPAPKGFPYPEAGVSPKA